MPRLPEHCIEYARILQWPKEKPFGGKMELHFCPSDYSYNLSGVLVQILAWMETIQSTSSGCLKELKSEPLSSASQE